MSATQTWQRNAPMEPTMTLAAEFYAGTRAKAPVLDIVRIANGQREHVETIPVINKREARAVAKGMGATPWNF